MLKISTNRQSLLDVVLLSMGSDIARRRLSDWRLSRLSHKDQPFMNELSSFINQRVINESRIYAVYASHS